MFNPRHTFQSVTKQLIEGLEDGTVILRPDQANEAEIGEFEEATPSIKRDEAFISYSHKDKKFRDQLLAHLKPLDRAGRVSTWSDDQIQPGSQWFGEAQRALASSKVAVLLVTKDFLASDFIHEHELGPLLKEAATGGVAILWVLVRDCNWKRTPLKEYQAAFPPDKSLAQMKAERDSAWVKICEKIEAAANAGIEKVVI